MKRNKHTFVQIIAECRDFISKATAKPTALSTRQFESTPYTISHKLKTHADLMLAHPEMLDAFLELIPELKAYKGKGSRILVDSLPSIFESIIPTYVFTQLTEQEQCPDLRKPDAIAVFQTVADFALAEVKQKGKRSQRQADLRANYWSVLNTLAKHLDMPSVLTFAKLTAMDSKRNEKERAGAVGFLITSEEVSEALKPDPEIQSIFDTLQKSPPTRDILMQVLDYKVNFEDLSQMSALMQLEDREDEHND